MSCRLILAATMAALSIASGAESRHHFLAIRKPLTQPSSDAAETIALRHIRANAEQLGLKPADIDSIYVAKRYVTAHNGCTHLVMRQRFHGAEVYNSEWVVNIDRDGQILNAGGTLYPSPARMSHGDQTRAIAAVRSAVAAIHPELRDRFVPFADSARTAKAGRVRFARGPLPAEVEGAPVWYGFRGQLRPAWNFLVPGAESANTHAVTIDEESQNVLHQHALTFYQTQPSTPRGLVFDRDSPQPNPKPGTQITSAPPVAPRTMKSFRGDLFASPRGWTSGFETAGNNVIAGLNLPGTAFVVPKTVLTTNGDFTFPLQLETGYYPLSYSEAAVTNLFYWINMAHDLHYRYGFDEAAGNFQADNFEKGGVGGDPIYAYAQFGAQSAGAGQFRNAFYSAKGDQDGGPAMLGMFVAGGVGAYGDLYTDGSLEADVIVHEYTHGVSHRLARQVYFTHQGGAMGEAWGDFFGIEYTTPDGAPADGVYGHGEYYTQLWGTGVRTRPYSTDMDINPLTFANLGHVGPAPEVHADGEIWMEALWEARAALIRQFGEQEGRERIRRLVLDGMKLAIPQATMVDMRDSILLADRVDYQGASQEQLWAAFARRGLGALAYAENGDTSHVVASFDVPSTSGALRFHDGPIVINERARIILEDLNNDSPTALVQVTSGSGDLEDVMLSRRGSIFVGSISTRAETVGRQNGIIEAGTGDYLTAYYVDRKTASGATLVEATIPTMLPYSISSAQAPYSFPGETRTTISATGRAGFGLPFQFPFYDRKYSFVWMTANGLIFFDTPIASTNCTDAATLAKYSGIAPMWLPQGSVSLSGSAQPDEGFYFSRTADSMTFRWAGEYRAIGQASASPVNFAATLFRDGRILFQYGGGNATVATPAISSACGPAAVGLGNGHDVFAQSVILSSFANLNLQFEPSFNHSSLPVVSITTPSNGDRTQDLLRVIGTASDSGSTVSSVEVFIDRVQRARVIPTSTGQWNAALNLAALGIVPGEHSLSVRATNRRGGFRETDPITVTVEAGRQWEPVIRLEAPLDNATIKGALAVRGYAYNQNAAIASVDTLIDGFVVPRTNYGAARPDVCDALPAPKPPNCNGVGFAGTISTIQANPPVPNGVHKLQVRVRDQFGRDTFYPENPITIVVDNGAPVPVFGAIESPSPNAKLSGTVTVTGYVYSPGQKITSVTVVVDNNFSFSARTGQPRPELCASLPNADTCPNIGFTATVGTTTFANGPHVIGVEATNERGDVVTFPLLVKGGMNVFIEN